MRDEVVGKPLFHGMGHVLWKRRCADVVIMIDEAVLMSFIVIISTVNHVRTYNVHYDGEVWHAVDQGWNGWAF